MPATSKRAKEAALRREYDKLTRAYHSAGRAAMGKPEKSVAKRDYQIIKKERTRVGAQLGRLTGAHKGR